MPSLSAKELAVVKKAVVDTQRGLLQNRNHIQALYHALDSFLKEVLRVTKKRRKKGNRTGINNVSGINTKPLD